MNFSYAFFICYPKKFKTLNVLMYVVKKNQNNTKMELSRSDACVLLSL